MKNTMIFAVWGGMYILCGLLGLGSEPAGVGRVLLTLGFFLPPSLIFRNAKAEKNYARADEIRAELDSKGIILYFNYNTFF